MGLGQLFAGIPLTLNSKQLLRFVPNIPWVITM